MAIPDFQTLMLPLLELLKDGKPVKLSEMVEIMSDKYNLTEEERNEWLPSKVQKTMYNRVAWAKQYLKNSELIESPEKGLFKITQKGVAVLKEKPQKIDLRFLKNLDNGNVNQSINTLKKKILVYDKITMEKKYVFNSSTECSDYLSELFGSPFKRTMITSVCNGYKKSYKGFIFKYES